MYIHYIDLLGGNSYSNVLTFADFDLLPGAHQAHAASAPELFTARLARLASPHEAKCQFWLVNNGISQKTEADFMNPRFKRNRDEWGITQYKYYIHNTTIFIYNQ